MRKEKFMKKYKQHVRVANMLLQALYELKQQRLKQIRDKLRDFSGKCSDAKKNSKQFHSAVDKGWYLATERIRSRLKRDLVDFSHHLDTFKNAISKEDAKIPNQRDLVEGLFQLEQEFVEFNIDLDTKSISATTDNIVLKGMHFGLFEIKLFINKIPKLYSESPYKIVALDPNPAGADSDVTHPHVSCENLCEGDGIIPIRKAIEQGRLCDFFMIITQILQTYNPDSPYVSLSDWEGVSCYDCGYTVAGDDCYYCDNCQRDYCSSCSTYCQICDSTICLGCSFECPVCNQPVCKNCTAVCSECEETLCQDCINEEGLCNSCHEQRKENQDEELEEESTTPEAKPAVHPDSMGQTRIPA